MYWHNFNMIWPRFSAALLYWFDGHWSIGNRLKLARISALNGRGFFGPLKYSSDYSLWNHFAECISRNIDQQVMNQLSVLSLEEADQEWALRLNPWFVLFLNSVPHLLMLPSTQLPSYWMGTCVQCRHTLKRRQREREREKEREREQN